MLLFCDYQFYHLLRKICYSAGKLDQETERLSMFAVYSTLPFTTCNVDQHCHLVTNLCNVLGLQYYRIMTGGIYMYNGSPYNATNSHQIWHFKHLPTILKF